MEASQIPDLNVTDLRARIPTRHNLSNSFEPETIAAFSKRAKVSYPDGDDFAFPRKNNYIGNKSIINANESGISDLNETSYPTHREYAPSGDRSQRTNLMSTEAKPIETRPSKSQSYLPQKLVSQKLFGGISLILGTALISSVVLNVVVMQKANELENRTKELENIVFSGNYEEYNHKPLEEGLAANTDKINNLETTVIPDIQSDLSNNIDTTNNLKTVVIPSVQSDLSTNIAKTNNLETTVIPGIQSDLTTNIAKTNNLETVVIPDIWDNLLPNIAKTNNLETVVIPAIQSDLSTNIATTTNLATVVIPGIQTSLTANIATTTNLGTVVIPGIQTTLTANVAKTTTLEAKVNSLPKIYFGQTAPTAWVAYTSPGLTQTVDISSYGFVNPPIVMTSLGGNGGHWMTIGVSSVYQITKNTFIVYIRYPDGSAMSPSTAITNGWYLQYALFSTDP